MNYFLENNICPILKESYKEISFHAVRNKIEKEMID